MASVAAASLGPATHAGLVFLVAAPHIFPAQLILRLQPTCNLHESKTWRLGCASHSVSNSSLMLHRGCCPDL